MRLGRDFHVCRAAGGLGNGQAVGAQPLDVELDRLLDLALGLLNGVADSDAARKVRNVRRVIAFALFDDDRVAHGGNYG